jgi:hypothetical protein
MMPLPVIDHQAPVPPPAYQRGQARLGPALPIVVAPNGLLCMSRSSCLRSYTPYDDAPFAYPWLAWAVHLSHIRPLVIRLDAAYWGWRLFAWMHLVLPATAVLPWNPKRQKNRSCLPPTWRHARNWASGAGSNGFSGGSCCSFADHASAPLRLVCYRFAGRFDLHCLSRRRIGGEACWPP